jgi:ParD-like antitoxin of type II ParDE toxin-antitoxin system
MSAKSHISRMTLDIPEEDHKRLKALAAILGKSMREIVANWIHEHLYSANMPNKETLKAMESIEKGRDLVEADDAEDLFRKLGI